MALSLLATAAATRVARRAAAFALALAVGALAGIGWNTDLTNWAYYGFLQSFLDPRAQMVNQALGLALAFLAGLIHVVAV